MAKYRLTEIESMDQHELIEELSKKEFSAKHLNVRSNTLSRWEEGGVVERGKSSEPQWRRYSLVDLLWIAVVKELKSFGYKASPLKKVKRSLLDEADQSLSVSGLLLWVIEMLKDNSQIRISVSKEGEVTKLDNRKYSQLIKKGKVESHIYLDLNQLIQIAFKDIESERREKIDKLKSK